MAWLISKGDVPYRDFFEHHMPGVWYLLAPIASTYYEKFRVVYAARIVSFLAGVGIAYLTYLIAKKYVESDTALLSSALVFLDYGFFHNGLEVRPDIILTLVWLASFYVLSQTFDRKPNFFFAGIILGMAFFFKQTIVFPIIAITLSILFYSLKKNLVLAGLRNLVCLWIGLTIVLSLIALYFASNGALNQLIFQNFSFNFGLKSPSFAEKMFVYLKGALINPLFWITAFMGVALNTKNILKKDSSWSDTLLYTTTFILIFTSSPLNFFARWYYFPVLPLLAIYSSMIIKSLYNRSSITKYAVAFILLASFAGFIHQVRLTNEADEELYNLILSVTPSDKKVFDDRKSIYRRQCVRHFVTKTVSEEYINILSNEASSKECYTVHLPSAIRIHQWVRDNITKNYNHVGLGVYVQS